MKSSGNEREVRGEVVIVGIKGWKRKIARRLKEGVEFYRSAQSTLESRIYKCSMEI